MKKRFKLLVAIFALLGMSVLVAAGCKKEEEDDKTIELLAVAYLLSGNCATVTKVSATTYVAGVSGVPNGGCNAATVVGETRAQGLANARGTLTRALTTYRNASALQCATSITTTEASANALTESNFCATLTSLGIGSNACDTEARWAEEVGKRRWFSVGNGRDEALTNILNTGGLTLTAAQVAAARLASVDEITQLSLIAGATDACKNALVGSFPTLARSAVASLTSTTAVDGVTPVAQISRPVLSSASCFYGSASTDTNRCATLRTEF